MANGTIAFDTLSTSGQIESRTTGLSIDTDYLVNGSGKVWCALNGESTIAIRDSFNTTSITDNGTGDYTVTYNNDFSVAGGVVVSPSGQSFTTPINDLPATTETRCITRNSSNANADTQYFSILSNGELA